MEKFFSGINNISNSNLNLFQKTSDINMNGLSLDNVQFSSVNGMLGNFNVTNMNINGTNNFSIDLDGMNGISDKFTIGNLSGNGIANVAHYNIIGVPTAERIDFEYSTLP